MSGQRGRGADELRRGLVAHRLHAAYTVPACCQIVTFPAGQSERRRIFAEAFLARAEAALIDLEARAAVNKAIGL